MVEFLYLNKGAIGSPNQAFKSDFQSVLAAILFALGLLTTENGDSNSCTSNSIIVFWL